MNVDCLSLSLQATGGGLAGAAFAKGESPWTGTYIMVAGIISQLVSTCVFSALLGLVLYRSRLIIQKSPSLKRITLSMVITVTCMIARGIYRSIELSDGWRGYLFTHQIYAIILDALLMFIASFTLNVLNPAALVGDLRRYEGSILLD
jgi:hypothetical protein